MIKDRGQKKLATLFCAVQGMVPFVEVIVRSFASIEDSPVDITDIDVLGVEIGHFGRTHRTLFDCKTTHKQSGVNRALWSSGLRHLIGAEHGFVIQTKSVPDSHRLAASTMGINIHTEDSFRRYATSLNSGFLKDSTYLNNMDLWDELLVSENTNSAIRDLSFFVNTKAALELSGPKGVRLGLSFLLQAAGELDPAKKRHNILIGCAVSAFLLHIAMSISVLKDIFDFGMGRHDFEQRLRYFLWEGRENYDIRLKLRRALSERTGECGDHTSGFDLPEWEKLVELFRSYLDAPEALAKLPLVVKEIAFRNAAPTFQPDADRRIAGLLSSNNRGRQFIFAAATYLTQAVGLPREFQNSLEATVNSLIG